MDWEIEQLHTAARRYCIEHHRHWCEEYDRLQKGRELRMPYTYTDRDYDVFPRYHVMDAMRLGIERFVPADFGSFDEAKKMLCAAAESAQTMFTEDPSSPIEVAAMDEEREKFVDYLSGLTPDSIDYVEPLPYRRVLGKEENSAVWGRVADGWQIDGYWYPLAKSARGDVEAFQDRHFAASGGADILKRALGQRAVARVFELREYEASYELDLEWARFLYGPDEVFWTDDTLEWIVYASHESSVTVGGWLLAELKSAWSGWRDRIWTTPFFD